MPKAKRSECRSWAAVSWLLWAGACWAAAAVQAQTPSVLDVVEGAKQTKLQEYNKSLNDAYKAAPGALPDAPKAGPALPDAPPAVLAPPVLRAIYGVNQLIEAEVLFDGQSHSLYSDDARAEIDPWTYGLVFREGVLLVQKPLSAKQSNLLGSLSERGVERLISCKKLDLPRNRCLFLAASKASTGTLAPPRGASAPFSGALPPLPR